MQFIALILGLSFISAGILFLVYLQIPVVDAALKSLFARTLVNIFFLLLVITSIISWLFIWARSGYHKTLIELRSQARMLAKEVVAHKKTTSALKIAKELAESESEAKSRYLASLSHELRTPLNVLLGYAQLLMRDQGLLPKQYQAIAIIRRNGDHLADLIESILEISKIEAGKMTLQRDEFNLSVILQQLVDMFQLQANKKGLKFHYIPCANLPDYVSTDKQRFRQILINLISNAIKYTHQGSITFKVTYRSEVANFSIIDTGVGISHSHQDLIFKPFEQIRNRHAPVIAGTGLGLTISHALAELMGGEISLTSALGEGSIFTFRLMLSKVHIDPKEPEFNQYETVVYGGKKQSILIIDDDSEQRALLFDLLDSVGFEVLQAESAQQGFEHLKSANVDLLLMDVHMPEMNGWEMVKRMREQQYLMPVLMVSANARDAEYNLQAEGLHNGYIAKPVNLDALLGKIAQLLNLQWQYQKHNIKPPATVGINKTKAEPTNEHYQTLISLAEIGYLSGFKDKFSEIELAYCYPEGSAAQILEYVEVCNFPKIIEYLNELNHETKKQ